MIITEIFYGVKCDRCGEICESGDFQYWMDETQALEEYAQQQLSANKQRPHICPVCCGRQYVMPGFYDGYSSTALNTELCRTCGGIGIVWEPGRKDEGK